MFLQTGYMFAIYCVMANLKMRLMYRLCLFNLMISRYYQAFAMFDSALLFVKINISCHENRVN